VWGGRGKGGMGGGSRGKVVPHFMGESYALVKRLVGLGLRLQLVVAEACQPVVLKMSLISLALDADIGRLTDRSIH